MTRNVHWGETSSTSTGGSKTSESATSAHSRSTAPTEESCRPQLPQADTCYGRMEGWHDYHSFDGSCDDARVSVDTYSSTVPSEADDSGEEDEVPEYEVQDLSMEHQGREAIAATPRDFGDLFPTSRALTIAHDDSTVDGNMNLRVDVPIRIRGGQQRPMTLFHLRMHDLRNREFSLRRYCRDSGREVCHSVRKYQKPAAEKRPSLQKSFSSAMATIRSSKSSHAPSLHRQDSGYGSVHGPTSPRNSTFRSKTAPKKAPSMMPTNTIKLEFSNYAHIDCKRRGTKQKKHYDFEYWGHQYTWRKVARKDGDKQTISYHLLCDDETLSLAHIAPVHLSKTETKEEESKGGWIPPSALRILDDRILDSTDLADIVVSTGLMALVDDCIKQRFHAKQTTQIMIPLTKNASFKVNVDAPKRLIDEVFHFGSRVMADSRPNHVRGVR